MRTVSEKSAAKDKTLQPFAVREAVVGRADEPLLKYLNFFKGPIPVEGLSFLHVIPNTRARLPLTVAPGVEVRREDEEAALRALSEKVKIALPDRAASDVQYFVEEGSPLEKLLALADDKKADMLVIGRKADTLAHGILSKNLKV